MLGWIGHTTGSGLLSVCDVGVIYCYYSATVMSSPTYKDLIELLNEAEADQDEEISVAELLTTRFRQLYPHITISRPARFLATVQRINGPIGSGRLKGSSRKLYLKRIWTPRIRNTRVKQGISLRVSQ